MARKFSIEQDEFTERVIQIKRVSKKTKGGNKIGFTALVVVGDKKGKVGASLGKAPDVTSAIQKGIAQAKKNLVDINMSGTTIPHEIYNKYKSGYIMLKPAPAGSGIIAGGALRHVIELAGIHDISAKRLGSKNKNINVHCTIDALSKLREDKKVEVVEKSAVKAKK